MDRKANPIVHRTALFGGRETAMEVHRRLAWNNARCTGCGGLPVVCARTFVALTDMSMDTRVAIEVEIAMGRIKTTPTKQGQAICTGVAYACSGCKATMARQLAKGPSYAMTDWDEGPGEDPIIVAVPY